MQSIECQSLLSRTRDHHQGNISHRYPFIPCALYKLTCFFGGFLKWLQLIWSRTHLIPGLQVPHFLSLWTNGPQKFGPHGQMVPNQFGPPGQTVPIKFGPPGQMVPNQFGPHISKSSQLVPLDKQYILGPFV